MSVVSNHGSVPPEINYMKWVDVLSALRFRAVVRIKKKKFESRRLL